MPWTCLTSIFGDTRKKINHRCQGLFFHHMAQQGACWLEFFDHMPISILAGNLFPMSRAIFIVHEISLKFRAKALWTQVPVSTYDQHNSPFHIPGLKTVQDRSSAGLSRGSVVVGGVVGVNHQKIFFPFQACIVKPEKHRSSRNTRRGHA